MTNEETLKMLRTFGDVYGWPEHVAYGKTSLSDFVAGYCRVLKDLGGKDVEALENILLSSPDCTKFPAPGLILKASRSLGRYYSQQREKEHPREDEDRGFRRSRRRNAEVLCEES